MSPDTKIEKLKSSSSCKKLKTSYFISRSAARNLYHGTRFSNQVGGFQASRKYPVANVQAGVALNLFVTINWNLTKTQQDNFTQLRNQRFCRWLRTRCKQLGISVAPTYVYSRELGHVHWQVHVPDELIEEFTDLVPRWITSLENKGTPPRKRAQNHEPAPKGVVKTERARNGVAIRKYMLKGIHPRDAVRFGIRTVIPQGRVQGPRTGVSRSLGSGARSRAQYKPKPAVWMRGNGRLIPVPQASSTIAP